MSYPLSEQIMPSLLTKSMASFALLSPSQGLVVASSGFGLMTPDDRANTFPLHRSRLIPILTFAIVVDDWGREVSKSVKHFSAQPSALYNRGEQNTPGLRWAQAHRKWTAEDWKNIS